MYLYAYDNAWSGVAGRSREGAAIRRTHNGRTLRYVVAVLTRAQPAKERIGRRVLRDLIQHLDDLVVSA